MSTRRERVTPVDQLMNFTTGNPSPTGASAETPGRWAERRAAAADVPLEVPELAQAYRVICERKAVGGVPRTVYLTASELERLTRAGYALGGIPYGVMIHYAAALFLQEIEKKNGGPFPPIPNRE